MFILGVMSTTGSFRVTLTSDLRHNSHFIYVYVTEQPNSDTGCLTVEVSRSRARTHAHTVGLLWTSDQPFAETCTS